jgi:hypothetical protein
MIFGTAGICFFACEVESLVEVFFDTFEIFAVNRNGDGEVRALGEQVATMRFGPVTNGVGAGTIQSSGEVQPFDPFSIELSNAFAQAAGLPPPNGELVGITYSLVSLKDNISFRILQEFEFTPLLSLLLDVQETGETIQAPLSGSVNYRFPLYGELPGLHLTPRLALSGQLHNRTILCIDNSLDFSALAASFSDYNAGPAFGPYRFLELACVGGEITVYDETFAVEGFDTYTGATFFVQGVPEPGTAALAMTCTGLLLIALSFKRRRRQ